MILELDPPKVPSPTSSAKALVVEDEADIRSLIVRQLKQEGLQVDEVENGRLAAQKLVETPYDLVVVDWMMPELSGLELIKLLRVFPQCAQTPILMVTAKDRAEDIIQGLESGADDYLVKPFDFAVLAARIKALLRRRNSLIAQSQQKNLGSSSTSNKNQLSAPTTQLQIAQLKMDSERFSVSCHDKEVVLTPMEFKLLWALIQQPGKVLTRNKLIELAAGEGVNIIDRAVDTHLFAVRKKLGLCSELIETVRGVGYRIKELD